MKNGQNLITNGNSSGTMMPGVKTFGERAESHVDRPDSAILTMI